jgi:hypothetical protein
MVDDLDGAVAAFGVALGDEFLEPIEVGGVCRFPGGEFSWRNRITYSRRGPVRHELIEVLEPTGWETVPGGLPVNHVGHWVEDLERSSAQLAEAGFPLAVEPLGGGGPEGWCYHANPHTGIAIELCSRPTLEPLLQAWWETGEMPT